jgi:hypothetical protein
MSDVYFHLRSASASGFAVGEIWRAFAHVAFDKLSFTAYYGQDSDPVVLTLPPGDYWVQLKLPHGELTRELVMIPDQDRLFEVTLDIPQPKQLRTSPLSAFSATEYAALRVGDRIGSVPAIPMDVLAPPGQTPRTRRIAAPATPVSLPTFTLDLFSDLASASGEELLLKSRSLAHFSLARVGAKFLAWPRMPFGRVGNRERVFIQPDKYFNSALRYATENGGMPVVVDGDSVTAEIPTLDYRDFARNHRDVLDGRYKRDVVIVKGERNRAEFLVTIPNGWRGKSAQLRITKNFSNYGKPLNISVEVNDPKFNALLQFIKGGDLDSAIRVIESSVELLYAKFDNPFAAAAAGYVLIQAAPRTLQVPWKVWIANLARQFADLPDGEILHATLLLQRSDARDWDGYGDDDGLYFPEDERDRYKLAAKIILSALGKGPPMFRPGLSLLASNLRILQSIELPGDIRLLLNEGEKLVTWLSMRVDPNEPFCVFRLKG